MEMEIAIPKSVENLNLPAPELVQYYEDLENRTIWIQGEIEDDLFEYSKQIMRWNREDKYVSVEDRIPIKLFIDSPGGDLESTLAFIGLVALSKTPIWTISAGIAYSAAGLILMSGHRRFAMPHSQALIHSGSSVLGGSYEQTTEQMKNYKQLVDKMREFILAHTKIDPKLFKKNSQKDWFIPTEEMLELGLVDEMITDMDLLL